MPATDAQLILEWINEASRIACGERANHEDALNHAAETNLRVAYGGDTPTQRENAKQAQTQAEIASRGLHKAYANLNAAIRAYVDWYPADDLRLKIKEDND